MVGTAILQFPFAFKGGKLVTRGPHESSYSNHTVLCAADSNVAKIALLFADHPHSVSKVTSGSRVTMTFPIFREPIAAPDRRIVNMESENKGEEGDAAAGEYNQADAEVASLEETSAEICDLIKKLETVYVDGEEGTHVRIGILSTHDAVLGSPNPLVTSPYNVLLKHLKWNFQSAEVTAVLDSRSWSNGGDDESDSDHGASIFPIRKEWITDVLEGRKPDHGQVAGMDFIIDASDDILTLETHNSPTYFAGNETEYGSFAGLYFRSIIIVTT
jgi:hypothetical protein